MIEPKRPLRVFLCHAPEDRDVVYDLYFQLTCDGIDAWLGKEKLLPGQNWEFEIREAIHKADVVIVCLSKKFNQEGYQQKIVRIALNKVEMKPDGSIFIIPACLEECDVFDSLKRWSPVNLFEVDAYDKLMLALKACADRIGVKLRIGGGNINDPARGKIPKQKDISSSSHKTSNKQNQGKIQKRGLPKNERLSKKTIPLKAKTKKRKVTKIETTIAITGVVATIIAGFLSSPLLEKWLPVSPVSIVTSRPAVNPEAFPAMLYPTEFLDIDLAGNSISMRLVPIGKFAMGSNYGIYDGNFISAVNLDAFYVDTYEVTNALYKSCVSAGVCELPKNITSYARNNYYDNVNFDNYPVVNVSWHMALSFCKWRGADLPTEAQWEKAARGGVEGKSYPWGDKQPVCKKGAENSAKFDGAECDFKDTDAVGGYSPNGFGLYDMAGNVWEWTSSLFRPYPYISTDGREDPNIPGARVLRGGSFLNAEYLLRVSFRNKIDPNIGSNVIGFHCVRTP